MSITARGASFLWYTPYIDMLMVHQQQHHSAYILQISIFTIPPRLLYFLIAYLW